MTAVGRALGRPSAPNQALAILFFASCALPRAGSAPPPGAAEAPPASAPALPGALADPALYMDPEGLFTIRFGVPPSVEVQRKPLGAGEIVTTTASTSNDARLLMAMKLAMSDVAGYDCARGLDGMRDETLANMGACAPTSERTVSLRGRPGREVLFACARRPMRGALAIYCDLSAAHSAKRVTTYAVIAAYAERVYDEPAARAFLGSFDLR